MSLSGDCTCHDGIEMSFLWCQIESPLTIYKALSGPKPRKKPKKVSKESFRVLVETFSRLSRLFQDFFQTLGGPWGWRPRETFFRLFRGFGPSDGFPSIEVAYVSVLVSNLFFWHPDSAFFCSAPRSSPSWDQPVLFWGPRYRVNWRSQKVSMPKRRLKHLDTKKDISTPTKRVTTLGHQDLQCRSQIMSSDMMASFDLFLRPGPHGRSPQPWVGLGCLPDERRKVGSGTFVRGGGLSQERLHAQGNATTGTFVM